MRCRRGLAAERFARKPQMPQTAAFKKTPPQFANRADLQSGQTCKTCALADCAQLRNVRVCGTDKKVLCKNPGLAPEKYSAGGDFLDGLRRQSSRARKRAQNPFRRNIFLRKIPRAPFGLPEFPRNACGFGTRRLGNGLFKLQNRFNPALQEILPKYANRTTTQTKNGAQIPPARQVRKGKKARALINSLIKQIDKPRR